MERSQSSLERCPCSWCGKQLPHEHQDRVTGAVLGIKDQGKLFSSRHDPGAVPELQTALLERFPVIPPVPLEEL